MSAREAHLVELVDDSGVAIGQSTVQEAHRAPGMLHRAFSVVLLDGDDHLLLQQRAAVKTRFALRWANACCGHPLPGQSLTDAANKRLGEEIGLGPISLTEVGVHLYQASDPDTGRVEYEYDHVLVGRIDRVELAFDPAEVATVDWVKPADLATGMQRYPNFYAPWLPGVVDAWQRSVVR